MTSNNTVHISLGTSANHVTSHLLNLQGLAATTSQSGGSGGDTNDDDVSSSLCDASVTHDISPVDSDYNSSRSGPASSRYMYVPRTLIVDGRDSFGTAWGGVSCNSNHYMSNQHQHQTVSSTTSATANGSDAWNGAVSVFDASDQANIFGDQQHSQNQQNDTRIPPQIQQQHEDDPLHKFQSAASIMGLSPIHSRFNATLPSHSSYNVSSSAASSSRHVQWDDEEEEEEEDDYCYGQNDERIQEEKRRQLEKMDRQQSEDRKNWNTCMEDAWEETFYGDTSAHDTHRPSSSMGSNEVNNNSKSETSENTDKATHNTTTERDIQWYDYWMPPKPSPSKYQVPLPFDTATTNSNSDPNSLWSTSFNMGYNPTSSGTTGGNSSNGITHSWREHVLSESLRKVLEGCDVVKGFNIFVDGGEGNSNGFSNNTDPSSNGGTNKHAKQLSNIMAGGGFHAGLATSLLEELSEECRSAGRWVVMIDPISSSNIHEKENNTEGNQVHRFRQRLNAGLALHGLSTNAGAFLPVSIEGAYTALRGTNSTPTSSNRMLFEGSAAVALALETSTLFYRLHHRQPPSSSSHSSGRRSRIGIQSGFYQGSSGNGYEDCDNEPYASAPALTYHEFLACARPSSDRRRSILELDALLRPISFPSTSGGGGSDMSGGGGVDVASLLASGGQVSPSMLASLTSSGLVGGGTNVMGELQKRIMRGTSVERMRMEQERQQYRSSRNRSSSRQSEPGDWMEDVSTLGGGGLLSSLSGNSTPFGRRANHHHFALSTSLRPATSEKVGDTSAFLRPMMESMGVRYRPEVSLGSVVRDSVSDLTEVGSYWRTIFADRRLSTVAAEREGNVSTQTTQQPPQKLSPRDIASHTSVLSVLGNSTRSYPRINSISTGFIDSLHSRSNRGYLSRDVMSGIMPEQDDCEEALEYCQELVDVYEPPLGSGLVDGEDENYDIDAYHDEDED